MSKDLKQSEFPHQVVQNPSPEVVVVEVVVEVPVVVVGVLTQPVPLLYN